MDFKLKLTFLCRTTSSCSAWWRCRRCSSRSRGPTRSRRPKSGTFELKNIVLASEWRKLCCFKRLNRNSLEIQLYHFKLILERTRRREKPGFELRLYEFTSQCSTTKPTRSANNLVIGKQEKIGAGEKSQTVKFRFKTGQSFYHSRILNQPNLTCVISGLHAIHKINVVYDLGWSFVISSFGHFLRRQNFSRGVTHRYWS